MQIKLLHDCINKWHFSFLFFPSARAEAYKEDGNYEYKRKKFKEAIAAYTEGIKIKCNDAGLDAILYTNRATAHFCLGISQRNSVWIDIFSGYLVMITYIEPGGLGNMFAGASDSQIVYSPARHCNPVAYFFFDRK